MTQQKRTQLMLLIVPLVIGIIVMQRILDPQVRKIHAGEKTPFAGLSNEFILGPLLGLEQAVAGLLWMRTDEFFHSGDYDAILPMVRMVTWLDPHNLDVFITGAWHLAYNFTDVNERSDRRYIPAAQALLREGDQKNQNAFDIAFEAGWQNQDKIKNYEKAEEWFRLASTRKANPTGLKWEDVPMFVFHMIAHSLQRQGRVLEAVEVWRQALAKSEKIVASKPANDFTARNVRDSEKHNMTLNLKRYFSRYTHEIDWDVDRAQTRSIDPKTGRPFPANAYLATDAKLDGVPVGTPRLPATARKWDVAFDCKVSFPQPKVLDLQGKFNVGDGARVTIRLHDEDWREQQLKEFTFDIDQSQTIMIDQHSVRNGKWGRKIDMSRDPKMYSFTRDNYYLVLEFDPRGTSPFIQDRFGWLGEGMTDKKYLWVDETKVKPVRMIRKVYKLSKQQIMGYEPVSDKDVIPNAEYARVQQQARVAVN